MGSQKRCEGLRFVVADVGGKGRPTKGWLQGGALGRGEIWCLEDHQEHQPWAETRPYLIMCTHMASSMQMYTNVPAVQDSPRVCTNRGTRLNRQAHTACRLRGIPAHNILHTDYRNTGPCGLELTHRMMYATCGHAHTPKDRSL